MSFCWRTGSGGEGKCDGKITEDVVFPTEPGLYTTFDLLTKREKEEGNRLTSL